MKNIKYKIIMKIALMIIKNNNFKIELKSFTKVTNVLSLDLLFVIMIMDFSATIVSTGMLLF